MNPFEALPYYRWHWRDYRANRKVQRMTYIERGLYRELLDECWAEGFIQTTWTLWRRSARVLNRYWRTAGRGCARVS